MVADDPFTPPHRTASPLPPSALVAPTTESSSAPASDSPPSHPLRSIQQSGARTPRRVQWTTDHIINVPQSENKDKDNEREHKHQPDLAHVNRALESLGDRRVSDGETEDYDYRLDPNPGEIEEEEDTPVEDERDTIRNLLKADGAEKVAGYVQLGETDGLPTYRPEETEKSTAANLVHQHAGTGKWSNIRRRVRSGSVVRRGRAGSAGHEAKPTEAAGPARTIRARRDSVTKPRRNSISRVPHSSGDDPEKALPAIGEGDEPTDVQPRVHANPPLNPPLRQAGMPHLPGGTSVLSSLLALYHSTPHPFDSATTSAASTPSSTRPPSPEKTEDLEDERGRSKRKRRSKSPWRRKHSTSPPSTNPPSTSTPPPTSAGASEFSHKQRTKSTSSLIHSVSRVIDDIRDDRPKAARSGAGVFGALLANTASMAAVAAPASSTLVPAFNKPGYHLNRYSLKTDSPPLASPPFKSGSGFNFGSRPNSSTNLSNLRDRSTSPGRSSRPTSWYSNSNDTKDDLGRAHSSDNLIEMKSRRKSRPSPLILKSNRSSEKMQELTEDDRRRREWEQEKKRRKKAKEARKKQEVYIIQHVAAILSRQQFILKLARALMMFGSPTHRLETQIQATAKVLDINAQVVYLPNIMLISFADDSTHTSETKFLKQAAGLDLGKLLETHNLYWEVVHDRMSVEDAGLELDRLMTMPPRYNAWQMIIIAGFCSSFIVIQSYFGSFLDALMVAPLGMMLQAVQIIALKNDLFSGVFEIVIATMISFVAAVLASSHYFCFTALVSGGIVLILPGFIVLSGALELASRNITSGAVRMGYSVIYSLFLGFGISMGSEIYVKIRNQSVTNATNNTCTNTHYEGAPWYLTQPSPYWYFLTVPMFSFFLSLNLQQPIRSKELPVMVTFACAGWVTNYFSARAFPGRSDIVSAIGSFCVGILGNLYGRISRGASFPVMVTGILMQLPSGLKEGGLFNFASDTSGGSLAQYSTGFRVAAQLVSVAVGLTVGLFIAAVVMHPLGGSRRRGAGIFSF